MDILERLRDPEYDWCNNNKKCNGPMFMEAADEIERLRQQNAELIEALKYYACDCKNGTCKSPYSDCGDVARDAIAKATGGK